MFNPQPAFKMNNTSICPAAERYTGMIAIENVPGCDPTVQFTVPVRETSRAADPGDVPPAKSKCSLRILCIDDDPHVREFMTDCLGHFDHQVLVATGGKQGLEMFRAATRENQPYDVVITDLGMPDINGHCVARTIKAESPHVPVIMLTGWGKTIRDDGDTSPGADIVVSKPPRMSELNDLVLRMTKPACGTGKEER